MKCSSEYIYRNVIRNVRILLIAAENLTDLLQLNRDALSDGWEILLYDILSKLDSSRFQLHGKRKRSLKYFDSTTWNKTNNFDILNKLKNQRGRNQSQQLCEI